MSAHSDKTWLEFYEWLRVQRVKASSLGSAHVLASNLLRHDEKLIGLKEIKLPQEQSHE